AIAFTAWLMAPAPMACSSTCPRSRTMPAMAPATAAGREDDETFSAAGAGSATGNGGAGSLHGAAAPGAESEGPAGSWIDIVMGAARTLPEPAVEGNRFGGRMVPNSTGRPAGGAPGTTRRYFA